MTRTTPRSLVLVGALLAASAPLGAFAADVDLVPPKQKPDFSYGQWDPIAKAATSSTVSLDGVSGKGGFGYILSSNVSREADASPALRLTVGAANQAKSLRMLVRDEDGTVHKYVLHLPSEAGQATVTPVDGASLTEPNEIDKPGDTPGLDLLTLSQVQVLGDWQDAALDVTVDAVLLQTTGPELMAKRKERDAKREAERLAAEQAVEDALANLQRNPGSPVVEHVAPVAADLLSLTIRAGDAPRHPQVAYVPQAGDEIKPNGKHEAFARTRDGGFAVVPETFTLHRLVDGKLTAIGYITADHRWVWTYDKLEGDALAEVLADRPAGYRIVSTDDERFGSPVEPLEIFRKSKPTYQVDPNRDVAAMVHRVFLRLPHGLREGATYTIEFPGLNTREASFRYTHDPRSVRTDALHATQIGHRPDDPHKVAYLSMWLGTGGGMAYDADRFELIDESGAAVYTGEVRQTKALGESEKLVVQKDYAKTAVYALDFSAFSTPGTYRVYLPGVGTSGPIRIEESAWADAFKTSMMGFLHHRSGIELGPPLTDYQRPRSFHPADGVEVFKLDVGKRGESATVNEALVRLTDGGKKPRSEWPETSEEAWGGYMDAGDWDRRSGHLLPSYLHLELLELYPAYFGGLSLRVPEAEASNDLPDLLDEVLWNASFYCRIQDADGGIRGGVESTAHPRGGEASWQESLGVGLFAAEAESELSLRRRRRESVAPDRGSRSRRGGRLAGVRGPRLGLGAGAPRGLPRRGGAAGQGGGRAAAGRAAGGGGAVPPHRRSRVRRPLRRSEHAGLGRAGPRRERGLHLRPAPRRTR